MREAAPTLSPEHEQFYSSHVTIPSETFFPNPTEQQREYKLQGRLMRPEYGNAETAVLFVHGASGPNKNPTSTYSEFQTELALGTENTHGITSLVFNTRGIGIDTEKSDEDFNQQSFNDRSDDALNALFFLDDTTHPKSIIVSGVSMGGHAAIKMLDKLHDLAASNHPRRQQAQELLRKIKGLGLFAPAAYPPSTEYLPAVPPHGNKNDPRARTAILQSFESRPEELVAQTDIFHLLDMYRFKWPVWVAFGENDTVIPKEVQQAFRDDVFLPDENFVTVADSPHDGLLGKKFAWLHNRFMQFAQKVSQ